MYLFAYTVYHKTIKNGDKLFKKTLLRVSLVLHFQQFSCKVYLYGNVPSFTWLCESPTHYSVGR